MVAAIPDTDGTPSSKLGVKRRPRPTAVGLVTPRRPCLGTSKTADDHMAIINAWTAPHFRRQRELDDCSFFIGQVTALRWELWLARTVDAFSVISVSLRSPAPTAPRSAIA